MTATKLFYSILRTRGFLFRGPLRSTLRIVCLLLSFELWMGHINAQNAATANPLPERTVPSRLVPAPAAASTQLQRSESDYRPAKPFIEPKSNQEWKKRIDSVNSSFPIKMGAIAAYFKVSYSLELIDGVKTYTVTPDTVGRENQNRVLLHFHGGDFIYFGGELSVYEAILMAHYAKIKVVSVDYRVAPDYPFPAPLEDGIAVYKHLLKSYSPGQIGIFGTSAGGNITAGVILKIHEIGLPEPAVAALLTPGVDITKTGDTWYTNDGIDVGLHYNDELTAVAKLYANGHDMKEPLISPVYGDLGCFPPTIVVAGTRDVVLSDAVRIHRKLKHAGIIADLNVFEGMSHGMYLIPGSPESLDVFETVTAFFSKFLKN
jgi:epsilon-lactone hydrolase